MKFNDSGSSYAYIMVAGKCIIWEVGYGYNDNISLVIFVINSGSLYDC